MPKDYKLGKFEDRPILPEKEFSESLIDVVPAVCASRWEMMASDLGVQVH